jgi:hypothetical protein
LLLLKGALPAAVVIITTTIETAIEIAGVRALRPTVEEIVVVVGVARSGTIAMLTGVIGIVGTVDKLYIADGTCVNALYGKKRHRTYYVGLTL